MNPKEENEKLLQENASLVKTNADISQSINASKLSFEQAKEQELAGKSILVNIGREIEEAHTSAEVAKKEVKELNSEVEKLIEKKTKLELSIIEAEVESGEKYKAERIKHESEIEKLSSNIQVKRGELAEITTKLVTDKSKLDLINLDIKNAADDRDVANAQMSGLELSIKEKKRELIDLEEELEEITTSVKLAEQTLSDTKASTESYEDRKAELITEINTLNDEINIAKTTIADINAEITEFEAKKEEKETEYKASVSKIFDLLRREEAVSEREEYAKGRFKEAGLDY